MIRVCRLAVAVLLTMGGVLGTAVPSWAGEPPRSGAVTAGAARVQLVGQTTWVRLGGVFTLDLRITAPHPASDVVQVEAFPPVTTRSGFEAAASGVEASGADWFDVQPVESLPADPAGTGVQVRIPVDATTTTAPSDEKAFVPGPEAVYPLEVQLFAQHSPLGRAFTTFLVLAPGSAQAARRLAVALVLPLPAAAPALDRRLRLVPTGARALAATTRVLESEPGVKVSLEPDPEELAAVAGGSPAGRAAVRSVAGLVSAGDELMASSYVPVDYRRLQSSGLAGQVGPQLTAGSEVLRREAGHSPSQRSWAVDGRLDDSTLETLERAGLRRLVLPSKDLSQLPAADTTVTFARPTPLVGGIAKAEVWGADGVLSSRLADWRQPVLAAEQDLAEMAVTELEAPSVQRGVALLAPGGVDNQLLSTLLAGLAGNPYLVPVTVAQLFERVPIPAGVPARRIVAPPPAAIIGDQAGIVGLSADLGSFRQLVPSDSSLAGEVLRALLVAESDRLPRGGGGRVITEALARLRSWERRISLPPSTSVTFTSRSARLPITIQSVAHTRVHVRLELTAPTLQFSSPRGVPARCRVTSQGVTCGLVLDGPVTTVRFPVVSRTSGVFALTVRLTTPDGRVLLGSGSDTIRSTAVSWVGLVLMVGAAISLLLWWVRNARHGRRARRLVPRPGDGGEDREPAGTGTPRRVTAG